MGSDNEPARTLLPYLQRADELQKHELLVAYYCRLFAMEKGMKIPPKERTKTTNSLLVSLMNQLEKDKKLLKFGAEDNLYVEGFALNVFAKADKQDRAGRADLNTAKTFYAASIFFEVLEQFGELQPDIEQKRKYSIWKAGNIRKALKEGRKPEPGPPGGEKDLSITSTSDNSYDLDSNHNLPSNYPTDSSHTQDPQDKSIQPPSTTTVSPPFHSTTNYPAHDYHQSPPSTKPENYVQPHSYSPDHQQYPCSPPNPMYQSFSNDSQQHYNQSYTPEQQYRHPLSPENNNQSSQNYPHDNSTLSYTHSSYQSYPSFNDGNRPPNLTHYPSSHETNPAHYPSSHETNPAHYPSSHEQVVHYVPTPSNDGLVQCGNVSPQLVTFHYDVNYQPPPEKIVDAHKAARFAVGALAFDDVPVAVEFLKRSLELLTNPSASQ